MAHTTLETGVRGTDRCPICGLPMMRLQSWRARKYAWLFCEALDHTARVRLLIGSKAHKARFGEASND